VNLAVMMSLKEVMCLVLFFFYGTSLFLFLFCFVTLVRFLTGFEFFIIKSKVK
jgi:hypothetical protein